MLETRAVLWPLTKETKGRRGRAKCCDWLSAPACCSLALVSCVHYVSLCSCPCLNVCTVGYSHRISRWTFARLAFPCRSAITSLPLPYHTPAMESTDAPSTHARPPPLNREPSNTRPKGILKNVTSPVPGDDPGAGFPASTAPTAEGATTLRWDEVNLNLNEVNRDATMKITEPKVRRWTAKGRIGADACGAW